MAEEEDENGWTPVVRCRSSRSRPRSHPAAMARSLGRRRPRAVGASFPGPTFLFPMSPQEREDEERRILDRLNRSIQALEQSEFYRCFLEQLLSPVVMGNIRRAATVKVQGNAAIRSPEGTQSMDCSVDLHALGQMDETISTARPSTSSSLQENAVVLSPEEALIHDSSVDLCSAEKTNETIPTSEGEREDGRDWQLDLVAYGIGSIADSEISRRQFSLLLLLRRKFLWIREIDIYDPVLSQAELNVIQTLGCRHTAVNEEGKRIAERPTIFYMPHCEEWLYNNVLSVNWSASKLCNLIVLGNSFQSYQERTRLPSQIFFTDCVAARN